MLDDLLMIPTLNLNPLNEDGNTPLNEMLQHNLIDYAIKLIQDCRCDINHCNSKGESPLYFAVSIKNQPLINALIKANAFVNLPNTNGMTPLYKAVENHDFEITELLLKSGANPNLWYTNGSLPINIADPSISKLLISYGARQKANSFLPKQK